MKKKKKTKQKTIKQVKKQKRSVAPGKIKPCHHCGYKFTYLHGGKCPLCKKCKECRQNLRGCCCLEGE